VPSNLDIAAATIAAKVQEVTGIENTETRPRFFTGRKFPAIFVAYQGFKQTPMTYRSHKVVYRYLLTLYLKLDGKGIDTKWDTLLDLTNAITDTFRNSFTLDNDLILKAEIKGGKVIIDVPKNPDAKPYWLGHRFELDVTFEES